MARLGPIVGMPGRWFKRAKRLKPDGRRPLKRPRFRDARCQSRPYKDRPIPTQARCTGLAFSVSELIVPITRFALYITELIPPTTRLTFAIIGLILPITRLVLYITGFTFLSLSHTLVSRRARSGGDGML